MRVLITGGAGFIGSALSRHAVGVRSWDTLVVDKLTYAGHLSSLDPISGSNHFRFVRASVSDRDSIEDCFSSFQPDAVVHLAAESHVDRSIERPSDFIDTNVVGTYTLLEAALAHFQKLPRALQQAFRFIHFSTDEVFGALAGAAAFAETATYDPSSPYSASKAASDHLVRAWGRTYGLPVVLVNCGNVFGPYQYPEKLMPVAILNGMARHRIPLYGDGMHFRNWLFIDDLIDAIVGVIERAPAGERYNIAGDRAVANKTTVEMICDVLDRLLQDGPSRRSLIESVPDRPGHDRGYTLDTKKIRGELGWCPKTDFESGVEATVRWYVDNREWWMPIGGSSASRLGLAHA